MGTVQHALIGSGLLLAAGGCAFDPVACEGTECEESLSSVAEPAFANEPPNPWILTNGTFRLCFHRDASLPTAGYDAMKAYIVSFLNNSWGNIPGLNFAADCAAPAMDVILNTTIGAGHCGVGPGAVCVFGGDPANLTTLDGVTIHEVGHGMGLLHEHQRPDAPPLCTPEQNILAGCQACTAATCSVAEAMACYFFVTNKNITLTTQDKALAQARLASGITACSTCAQGACIAGGPDPTTGVPTPANSYLACFGTNPVNGTVNQTSAARAEAQGRVNDRVVIQNGHLLTRMDPRSVMSYCSSFFGRTDAVPTPLDMLGMEMLYSNNRTYGLGCGGGCFTTATGLVTSTSGSIVSEWIARGSLGVPFRVSGAASDVYSYPVSGLASGTSTVSYTFSDPVGRSRSGSGSVTKGNVAYAALAGAVAMIF